MTLARVLGALPSAALFLASAGLVYALWTPSNSPAIFIFSKARFAAIAGVSAVAVYALASLIAARLRAFNALALYTVLAGLVIVEAALRLAPGMIPDHLLFLLPDEARSSLARERGLFTEDNVAGKGLLYTHKPGGDGAAGGMKIDANGFRNDALPAAPLDVVLVGASLLEAKGKPRELARQFRGRGMSAYTLAMGGWGPGQYRDAYREFIVGRGVAHKAVVVFQILPRDFALATAYRHAAETGGDWRDYMGRPSMIALPLLDTAMPWVVSILNKLPYHLFSLARAKAQAAKTPAAETIAQDAAPQAASSAAAPRGAHIRLPYVEETLSPNRFRWHETERAWAGVQQSLNDIAALAARAGAKPLAVLFPDISTILAPLVSEPPAEVLDWRRRAAQAAVRYKAMARAAGFETIDVGAPLQAWTRVEKITDHLRTPHLTQRGLDLLADHLAPILERKLER